MLRVSLILGCLVVAMGTWTVAHSAPAQTAELQLHLQAALPGLVKLLPPTDANFGGSRARKSVPGARPSWPKRAAGFKSS